MVQRGYLLVVTFAAVLIGLILLLLAFDRPAPAVHAAPLLQVPANDDFDNASLISVTPYTFIQDTSQATTAADDPVYQSCGTGSGSVHSHSVWYRFTPANNGNLHVDTSGSAYDTVLAVWTGSRGSLTHVACHDDVSWPGNRTSFVDVAVAAGTTYHIEIVSYGSSAGGSLTLHADFAAVKPLYLHHLTSTVVIVDGTNTTEIMDRGQVWGGEATVTFDNSPMYLSYLYPGLAGALILQGTVNVPLYLEADTQQNSNVTVGIADLAPDGSMTVVGTTSFVVPRGSDGWYTFTIPSVDYTVAQGHAVIVGMRTAAPPQDVTLHYDSATFSSRVELPTTSYVNVEQVSTGSTCHPGGTLYFNPGQAMTLTARVSDPFGSYDIAGADVEVTDPGGVAVVPELAMTPLVTATGAITYEHIYATPATAALGTYNVVVTGTESNGVRATKSVTFSIQSPAVLTSSLSAAPTTVDAGQAITVTMSVTNGGQATATGVAPSTLVAGGSGSALLVSGPSPALTDIPGGGTQNFTWVYTATSFGTVNWTGGATGTDANSCAPISAPATTSNDVLLVPDLKLEVGTVSVASDWITVTLGNTYDDMVVVCSLQNEESSPPLVARVRDAQDDSFQVKLQAAGAGAIPATTVHYMVMETGAYTLPNGVLIEAQKYTSTVTSGRSSWTPEFQTYLQSYTNPVVLGQVMSYNDSRWSVFWEQGSSRADAPSSTTLGTGKMVSKDTPRIRNDEVIGFIVIERGDDELMGVPYEAWVGNDSVAGMDNSPPYTYLFQQPFTTTPAVALVNQAGEDGGDGGWAVLYGDDPLATDAIDLAVDEDNINGDRSHTTEQVAYLVFEEPLVVGRKPFLEISKEVAHVGAGSLVLPGDTLVYTVDYANKSLMPATNVVVTDLLPGKVSFDAGPGCVHDGSPTGGLVTCAVGTVGTLGSGTIAITVTVNSNLSGSPILTNTATIDSAEGVSATTSITTPVTTLNLLKMETVTATVNHTWTPVNLSNTYNDMVVVCTPNYVPAHNSRPLATRVRNASESSFEVRLQNPGDAFSPAAETVHCLVMEAGAYTLPDGRIIEAQKYNSTVTDENSSWVGEAQTYLHSYSNPVVLGQVMSYNDSRWSVFWDRGASQTSPPDASNLWTGKTVCEDGDTTRADEIVGFVVIERGNGEIFGVAYEAWLGGDSVQGVNDSPPYSYIFNQPFDAPPQVALTSLAAMDGGNGGWAVLYGANPLSPNSIDLAIDEDQIGDSERNHTAEQVAYLVFEEPLVLRPTHDLHISKVGSPAPVAVGDPLVYTVVYTNTGVLTATNVVITEVYDGNVTFDASSPPPEAGYDNRWMVGDLAGGASGTVVVTVTVNGGLPDRTVLTNTVAIGSDQTAPVTATETTLARAFVLTLVKSDAPDPVMVGDLLTYTLTYSNTGVGDVTGAIITETYDGDAGFVSANPSPDAGYNNRWTIGDLGVGELGVVVITATVTGGTTLINQAEIDCDQGAMATATITTSVISLLKMEVFTTTVDHNWTTVSLSNTYNSMVVVCTSQYANNSLPLVTRVRNASASSFQVRLQNPHASNPDVALSAETVHCLVAEEGPAIMPGGRRIEARKYNSTLTDSDSSWAGEVQSYLHTYANPVVLGQVMSYNDPDWSVFWARGSSQANPPDPTDLYTGKTVAEDWDTARADETVGFIVIEQGDGEIFGVAYEAWLGADTVMGVENSPPPPYSYNFNQPFDSPPQVALASQAAMDGGNGAWALLYGSSPLTATSIDLVLDEDQISDSERWHTSEQVAYLVFEEPLVLRPSHDLVILKADDLDPVAVGSTLVYTLSYVNSGVVPATGIVITEAYDANVNFVSASPPPDAGYDNRWTVGDLEWGESEAILITVTVGNDLPDGTILTNRATIDSDQTDPVAATETTLVRSPVLQVFKSDNPDPVLVGNSLVYTIIYDNSGVLTATNVIITETYDSNVSFLSANPNPTVGNDVWNVGTLGAGGSGVIVVTVTVNGGTTLTNVVTIDSDQTPPQTVVENTTVGAVPVLHLAIADAPDPVLIGGVLVYTINYWNTGSGDAGGVVLTETVPANTTFNAAASTGGWSCPDGAPAGTVCTLNIGTLAPGPGGAADFAVNVNGGTLLSNQASIGCAEGVSASDIELTTVVVPDQVAIDKTVSPSTVDTPGERTTYDYAIVIHNAGPSAVNVQQITDTLPTGFNFITTTATIGLPDPDAIGVSGQDITWSYNSPYPSIAAGTSVTMTFVVTSSNDGGVYCNSAGVTIGGDVGVVASDNLACVKISWPVYQIESRVGNITIVVRVRLEPGGPVILSWEILP